MVCKLENGAIICSRGKAQCEHKGCMKSSSLLCDYPDGNGGTCDKRMCADHAHRVGPNTDYCTEHFNKFKKESMRK